MIPSDPPDHPETNASPANALTEDIEEQLHELSRNVRSTHEPILGRRPDETRLDAYDRLSRLPVFMFGMFILVGLVLRLGTGFDTYEGDTLVLIGWIGFVIDLLIRWALDENPLTFPKRHWLIFLAVLLPPLRLVLIGYVVVRMARSPRLLRNRLSVYALYLTILVVTFGAVIVLFILFEPLGVYGRWLKIRTWFELFPFYRRGMFRRQRTYTKSERLR